MSVDIFQDMNLAEINPDLAPVPDGLYKMRVVDAKIEPFSYKKDNPEKNIRAGDESTYVKLGFVIFDDPDQAGRKLYQTIFQDVKAARSLRLLMDATGVQQTATLTEWLQDLVNQRAEFTGPVSSFTDRSGRNRTEVRLTAVKPIQ